MGKKNDTKEICRKYNVVRDENRGKIFTLSELSTLLKGILPGLPTYSTTAQEFGLFEATKSGYKLPNDPVYIGRVENYLKEYRQKANELNKRSREKKAEMAASETPTNTQQPEIMDESELVESAIAVLKQIGNYRILKKVVTITWEEV